MLGRAATQASGPLLSAVARTTPGRAWALASSQRLTLASDTRRPDLQMKVRQSVTRSYAQGPPHPQKDASTPKDGKEPSGRSEPASESPETSKDANAPGSADAPPPPDHNPFAHLPDLTRGIPSAQEYEQSQRSSALSEVYPDESMGGRERGDMPASAYISSAERRRKALARRLILLSALGAVGTLGYLGRDWDDSIESAQHPDAPDGWSATAWWKRLRTRLGSNLTYYREPAFEKLLPDPDPAFARPYTLVLGLEDLLIHSEWSRDKGWRFVKRPGMDYFIRYLSQYYEIVVFTATPLAIAEPVIRKLDPFRFILWPLYREATKWKDGQMVKDLSYLNRDLSKVIMIDCDANLTQNQPENAVVLPKWTGDVKDQELIALIPFLEYIHTVQSADVRKVLKSFEGKHVPAEFARRELVARRAYEEKQRKPSGRTGKLGLGAFGFKGQPGPDGEQDPTEALAQGKMLQDLARERGQRNYMMVEREIQANGEKWLKEEQEVAEKAQKEFMSGVMTTAKSTLMPWSAPAEKEAEVAGNDKKA